MHNVVPLQVAFLTGQSNPRSAALTPAQAEFLAALPIAADGLILENFPYPHVDVTNVATALCAVSAGGQLPDSEHGTECRGHNQRQREQWRETCAPVSLPVASVRNALFYLSARRAGFAPRHGPRVAALVARAGYTLFLAGSCGLELFNHLGLSTEILRRVTILAYGPVARRRPDCACLLVQGRRDWLSRWYFRAVDVRVDAGHLDYLGDPTVRRLAADLVQRLAAP